ncbi:hypothetical protein Ahy_B08g089182 isoform A [Arachis hypogaea]|uniref:TMV resistance protein N n=1 Tax=Arachis hypogaea TaxID=3818 RepID=A0A444XX09_ARAHY|nr:hypothetical protein Ahy_B08g089182 isoform A [Arachis hypogaea]
MNITPPSSPSACRKKMLMISPSSYVSPLEEEEEEYAAIAEKGFYVYPGTEAIQSIVVDGNIELYEEQYTVRWRDLTFLNVCHLKLLSLDGVMAPILSYIPRSLRFLKKLKYLYLSDCFRLKRIPDLSEAPNLEILDVQFCKELNDFPSYLTRHKSLVKLILYGCSSLETLGSKLEMSSLKELDLDFCTSMRKLPEFGECMKHLLVLSLSKTAIEELPTTVGCLVGLKKLHLNGCERLTCLPDSIQKLKSLTLLNLSGCPNVLQSLHSLSSLTSLDTLKLSGCFLTFQESWSYNFANLVSLMDLDLSENNFVRVPINIHELPKLRRLNLDRCPNLKVLPELPSSIRELNARHSTSLDIKHWNVISKVCCGFAASTNHDSDGILQMWVAQNQIKIFGLTIGEEIPLWFVHQEEGNGVSVTLPHNETMALALCFRLCPTKSRPNFAQDSSVICNDYRFELVLPSYVQMKVENSGARWVCKQDIQDLKKIGTGTSKRKATFDLNF